MRGCLGGSAGCLLAGAVVVGLGSLAAGVAGALLYRHHVVLHPGSHLDPDHIRAIITEDSPVTYRDGHTRLGVFFEDEHREYVPWADLPPAYALSVVAAEDGGFWSHRGISPRGIARAMVANLKAGSVVAGGSTLTQQTAKNLYYRPDRSLRSKGQELLNALRLEAHYDKQEILTFYANQFHVSGNGRGIGIAARYLFDKDVDQLTVLECAYLAGLVKAPTYYDPFRGDADRQARARQRAHDRTTYVLQRLVAEDPARLAGPHPVEEAQRVQAEAARLLAEGFELQFQHGTFRFTSNAILDEVARRLGEPPFDAVLAAAGIEDPSTAGLVVVTTLDPDAQRESIYGLWHHLTEAGTMVEGLTASDYLRPDSKGPPHDPSRPLRRHEFREARVTAHLGTGSAVHLELDAGGHRCVVDRDGLTRVATAIRRGERRSRSARASRSQVDALVESIPTDSVVWISVREVGEEPVCDLEVRPELQGALVAAEQGQIRAMVGGNDNRNFNRAGALRQLGSTWKPLVYHAAIELGWSPEDPVYNARSAFSYGGSFYYPRPDHEPEPAVSMSWAGVRSENVASVWLLYHLTDHLDAAEVHELAVMLDLARRPSESEDTYRQRLASLGVTRTSLEEAAFMAARQQVLPTLEGTDHADDALALHNLVPGTGFEAERARLEGSREQGREWKVEALEHTWLRVVDRADACQAQYDALYESWQRSELPEPAVIEDLTAWVDDDGVVQLACGQPPEGYEPIDAELLTPRAGEEPDEVEEVPAPAVAEVEEVVEQPRSRRRRSRRKRRQQEPARPARKPVLTSLLDTLLPTPEPPELALPGELLVDGRLHLRTIERVRDARDRFVEVHRDQDPAHPDVLYWNPTFRNLLGIRYVAELGRRFGIRTPLAEVLSLPLGASEISIEEAVLVYTGITTGTQWSFPGEAHPPGGRMSALVESPPAPGLLIAELRDLDGNVIYRALPESREISSPLTGAMTADILRNIVLHGTGRRAESAVRLGGALVPLGGKTGTTNSFRNAAWLGYAPRVGPEGYEVAAGYVIGVYVGYDDNRPMVSGGVKLAGASGALPAWIHAVRGVYESGLLGEPPGQAAERHWPLAEPAALVRVAVDGGRGLPVLDEAGQPLAATQADPTSLLTRPTRITPSEVARLEPTFPVIRPGLRTSEASGSRVDDGQRHTVWDRMGGRPGGRPPPPPPP